MSDSDEFAVLNDPDLLDKRRRVREELQQLTEQYARLNDEVLLAEPEALGDDVLESCLYILRERLKATVARTCEPC